MHKIQSLVEAYYAETGMITDSIGDNSIVHLILSTAIYTAVSMECSCFLKCDADGGSKVMKSETVSVLSATAVPFDWRMR